MTASAPARILVVEDDPEVRELLEEHLTALGHQTVGVASAHDALAMIEPAPPDLILTAVADLDARVAGLAAGE